MIAEVETELRSTEEVVARCLALFACALRAESIVTNDEIPVANLQKHMPAAFAAMTPKEQAFFAEAKPDRTVLVNQTWRYEALWVLAWALGSTGDLNPPTAMCDVPAVAKMMAEGQGAAFARAAALRPEGEILDALDHHYRCHWATTEARQSKAEPPAGLIPGVVLERHYALNWLTGNDPSEWDDVTTPT